MLVHQDAVARGPGGWELGVSDRPGWDDYFIGVAVAVAARADCSKRKVGAVVTRDNRIISTGYNGAPSGDRGCLTDGACPRAQADVAPGSSYDTGPGSCISVHAEANALLSAGAASRGATLYVTCEPCGGCARLLRGAGIIRVVIGDGSEPLRVMLAGEGGWW